MKLYLKIHWGQEISFAICAGLHNFLQTLKPLPPRSVLYFMTHSILPKKLYRTQMGRGVGERGSLKFPSLKEVTKKGR